MQRSCLLFLSVSLLLFFKGNAQNGWTLKKEKDSIKVYSRSNGQSKFNELKVELILKARLSDLATLVLDIPNYPAWSFNTKTAYVLKRVSHSELYFYSQINSPWPASNRDLAVHLRITQDPASKVMSIAAESVPDLIPRKENLVRVPLSNEKWIVTPISETAIRIEYQLQIDPGAGVPALLINTFSTKGPYETFKNLRQRLRQPKYTNVSLPFIVN